MLPLCLTCEFRARRILDGYLMFVTANSGTIHLVKGEGYAMGDSQYNPPTKVDL
jgi:hypothetical protein